MKDYKHMRLTEEPLKVELKHYLISLLLLAILCIDKI